MQHHQHELTTSEKKDVSLVIMEIVNKQRLFDTTPPTTVTSQTDNFRIPFKCDIMVVKRL